MTGECQATGSTVAGAELWMAVFAADPTAAALNRGPAIRAAASAGCGLGTDTVTLTDPERRVWREQPSRMVQR